MNTRPMPEEMMWLDRQRERLLAELARSRAELDREEGQLQTVGTTHPRESGDLAEEEREDDEVAEVMTSVRAQHDAVAEALRRMDSGVYGACADCGQPIARARLEALPSAACCVSCERKREQPS